MIKTQIWNNSENISYQVEPIESFILYFTTGFETKNTPSFKNHEVLTKYMTEKTSTMQDPTGNSESENLPSILYGHGEFNLDLELIESGSGFSGQYYVHFRGCCWNGSAYNLTNPEIQLRKVSKKFIPVIFRAFIGNYVSGHIRQIKNSSPRQRFKMFKSRVLRHSKK